MHGESSLNSAWEQQFRGCCWVKGWGLQWNLAVLGTETTAVMAHLHLAVFDFVPGLPFLYWLRVWKWGFGSEIYQSRTHVNGTRSSWYCPLGVDGEWEQASLSCCFLECYVASTTNGLQVHRPCDSPSATICSTLHWKSARKTMCTSRYCI